MTYSETNVLLPASVPRDIRILHSVGVCGGLTAAHISTLYFPVATVNGKRATHSNCQYRLKLLREHGYVKRIERYQLPSDGKKPYVYRLTRKGAQYLARALGCEVVDVDWRERDWRLSADYVEHLIRTNDVRIALMRAVANRAHAVQLATWRDEVDLKERHSRDKLVLTTREGRKQTARLVPDGYFILRTSAPEEHIYHHFLEVDRATETGISSDEARRTWTRKIRLYLEYYRGGKESHYYARYGTFTGRGLTVTTSERRLANLKHLTEQAGGKQRFWFTTFERLSPQHVLDHPVWELAGGQGVQPLLWGDALQG